MYMLSQKLQLQFCSDRGESQIIRGFSLKEESEKLQFQLHLTAFRKTMLSESIAIFLSDMGNKISSYIPLCIFFLIVIVFIGLKIWIIQKLQHINRSMVAYDTRILDIEARTSHMAQINMNPQPQTMDTLA